MIHKNNFILDMRDPFGIGYSFSKNSYVEYTLSYEDKNIFTYFKTHISIQKSLSPIYEVYTGSDDIRGMHSILNFFLVSYTILSESIVNILYQGIDSGKVLELHYSVDPISRDITIYVYSKDIMFLKLINLDHDREAIYHSIYENIHMFCSKLKINAITRAIHTSIIFTSRNFENKDAYLHLQQSPLFPKEFQPDSIILDKKFITYEIAYSIDTQLVENFTLFYFPRAKNAKSSPL